MDKSDILFGEAEYFLHSCFQIQDDRAICELYVKAHDFVFVSSEIDIKNIDILAIVDKKLHVEAIEYYLRRHIPNNLLSKKLHILIYLLESQACYQRFFNNHKQAFLFGFLSLSLYTVRSIFLLIWGKYLVQRHHLVL
ncbi:hypothetical protein LPTSP4_03360 [Leptospira ryugenii]|uniref:Uncharacterized protein n=1 Tax=Leptospira ryugenii TaxID=1917863 RepID=A0A2P2DW36_9LEPT|nr:hypothetical protein [Leptospira ryugenii]GBF48836.1 hypothetical protein LPTSP4_03360 [Leptospira ryugenii]